MPQGLLGAPFTFAENISHIFSDMTSSVSAYFDDIVTEEEPSMHVQKVLDRLVKCSLCINLSNCQV